MTSLFDQRGISRRTLMKQILGGSAALVAAGATMSLASAAGEPDDAVFTGMGTTTATVNLRAGAGTGYQVLDVVPAGASIELYSGPAGNWGRVRYNGQFGYIHSDYIASSLAFEGEADMPAYTGMGTTTSSVNLRAGAGTGYQVLAVVPAGATIELYAGPAGNWGRVRYNGQFGYIHSDYIASTLDSEDEADMPAYTGMGTTTTTVNLRAGAGTGYQVLTVVPAGASIELYEGPAGSWGRVRYNGQFGYIHSDYIASVL